MEFLFPELMHEQIDKIFIHAPDRSNGCREQQVDFYFRFRIAEDTATASLTTLKKHSSPFEFAGC